MNASSPSDSISSKLTPSLQTLLDAAPDATLIVDGRGHIVLGNAQAERLFGYAPGRLTGVAVEELMPERFREQHVRHREQFQRGPRARGMGGGMRLSGLRGDGSEFPIEVSLKPLPPGEEAPWMIAAVRDIRDRLEREQLVHQNERVLESDLLKARFFANMSHELRTPLNAVIGFSELLLEGTPGPLTDQQQDFLSTILSSARHLHELINDMLDMARIDAGKLDFQPTRFALAAVLNEVRESMRVLAVHKDITLTVDVDAALDTVVLDPLKLKQVMINLVANAIKFTPERGSVSVRAQPEGEGMFRLEVEDTGPGIPGDQIDKLFVEFQQLDFGVRPRHEGTGLGLAITKRIAEAQGGRVGVSTAVGVGSVFYAVLPRRHLA